MVEVLNNKLVTYKKKSCTAELCIQTRWSTEGNRINTPFGVYSGLITSDKKAVDLYKKQGIKFSEDRYYFVRLMDKKGKCVKVLETYKGIKSAEKQFNKLKK